MNYSTITPDQLIERLDSLPRKIREIANSKVIQGRISQISRSHYLDEEKTFMLEQLIGLVLLGFISISDLGKEIKANLNLDVKHANDLVKELDLKVFHSIREDLKASYAPEVEPSKEEKKESIRETILGAMTKEKDTPAVKKATPEKLFDKQALKKKSAKITKALGVDEEAPEKKLGVDKKVQPAFSKVIKSKSDEKKSFKATVSKKAAAGKPLILHTEKKEGMVGKKAPVKSFSLPGVLFSKRMSAAEKKASPVEAQIEGSGISKSVAKQEVKKKSLGRVQSKLKSSIIGKIVKGEDKKVVHYSGARTPISPFGKEEDDGIFKVDTDRQKSEGQSAAANITKLGDQILKPSISAPPEVASGKVKGGEVRKRDEIKKSEPMVLKTDGTEGGIDSGKQAHQTPQLQVAKKTKKYSFSWPSFYKKEGASGPTRQSSQPPARPPAAMQQLRAGKKIDLSGKGEKEEVSDRPVSMPKLEGNTVHLR